MNSVSSEGGLGSVEMAGIDDSQSGAMIDDDSFEDEIVEHQYMHLPRQNAQGLEHVDNLFGKSMTMTPIQEEEELYNRKVTESSLRNSNSFV